MFGNSNGPLINRLEARFTPRQPPALPPFPIAESPRPSAVDGLVTPAQLPVTVAQAMATIAGALLKSAAADESAKELYRDWDALSEKLKSHFKVRKDTHLADLRKKDEELTAQGRELVEKINGLRREASGIRGSYNAEEEIASQLRLTLQGLGSDPRRRDDWDEAFFLPEEIAQWEERARDARAKVLSQEAVADGLRNRLAAKEGEIETASRKLAQIKEERKAARAELRGEFVSGPNGLRSWKVPEL
jgi:chromosome segregation ATPase